MYDRARHWVPRHERPVRVDDDENDHRPRCPERGDGHGERKVSIVQPQSKYGVRKRGRAIDGDGQGNLHC